MHICIIKQFSEDHWVGQGRAQTKSGHLILFPYTVLGHMQCETASEFQMIP